MTNTRPRTIVLIGHGRHEEYPADAALKPGHLIKLNATGEVLKHATAVREGERMIAKEDALQGKTIDDAYDTGDIVMCHICLPGDVVQCRLAAAASAIVVGNKLVSAGDGTVKLVVASTDDEMFEALEAVDNSAGASETFIKCRCL